MMERMVPATAQSKIVIYMNQGRIFGFDIRDAMALDAGDPCANNIVSIGGECNDMDGFGLPDAGYGESAEIEIPMNRG